jgi:hypothetical protein
VRQEQRWVPVTRALALASACCDSRGVGRWSSSTRYALFEAFALDVTDLAEMAARAVGDAI